MNKWSTDNFLKVEMTMCNTIMMNRYYYTLFQIHRIYTTKSRPNVNKLWTLDIMMSM